MMFFLDYFFILLYSKKKIFRMKNLVRGLEIKRGNFEKFEIAFYGPEVLFEMERLDIRRKI